MQRPLPVLIFGFLNLGGYEMRNDDGTTLTLPEYWIDASSNFRQDEALEVSSDCATE
ncbi:unnamed protein product [Wuchereria bancrofti]|uniref:Uncharacterized protein n=1 Tax=Wuchereria bancrofti TaxID=6293 RepID=A0A3P7FTF2_WUCBA|nr:unnamed protein product [Wuchereria bancrofti]